MANFADYVDALQALDRLFSREIEAEKVAALLIEPVQGEGGFYAAPFDFMRALREHCDRYGILLICDEVQSGFARTGRMFAVEYSDIDLALPKSTTTNEYLETFESILNLALAQHQPDFILYDAGVDIHKNDELGYFDISLNGIFERDRLVLSHCHRDRIPVAAVVGGGYRKDHQQLVELHTQLVHAAIAVYQPERMFRP